MALAGYGGVDVPMLKRLKELEAENARYQQMYPESVLKLAIVIGKPMAKKVGAPSARREMAKRIQVGA